MNNYDYIQSARRELVNIIEKYEYKKVKDKTANKIAYILDISHESPYDQPLEEMSKIISRTQDKHHLFQNLIELMECEYKYDMTVFRAYSRGIVSLPEMEVEISFTDKHIHVITLMLSSQRDTIKDIRDMLSASLHDSETHYRKMTSEWVEK